jgi:2-dehydropantoate 2-reductase
VKSSMESIAIVGAGAMGATYAALFHDFNPHGVAFIAGGERADRLRRDGVVVNGKPYLISIYPPDAILKPAGLVMVAVKHHHLEQAIQDMKHAVDADTIILSVMNGIDSEERLGATYGTEKVLYAIAVGMDAVRAGNRVNYRSQGKILFGAGPNPIEGERLQRVKELFDRTGIISEVSADMLRLLWWKFMINVGINQASAVLHGTYQLFQTSPEAKTLMEAAMREVMSVAEKVGVPLTEDDLKNWYKVLYALNPQGKTSMLQDVEAHQKTEVEMLAGKVTELGCRYGVPTPINTDLLHQIKAIETSYLSG